MRLSSLVAAAPVVVVAALLPAAFAPAQAAPALTCHGQEATIAAHRGTIAGTSGDDVIVATGPAVITSGAGDDLICGSASADVIDAGAGDDVVDAGSGRDTADGGSGRDELIGGSGADQLDGGTGRDDLFGGPGSDSLVNGGGAMTNDARSVSLESDPMSVSNLYASHRFVAIAIVPGSSTVPGKPVVMTAFRPMIMSYASWQRGPILYAATAEAPVGSTVAVAKAVATSPITRWAFNGGDFTPTRPNLDRTPTVISTESTARTFGFAQRVTGDLGTTALRPTSAVNLPGGKSVAMNQGDSAWIFVTNKAEGTVLDALPSNALEVSFAASPHARVIYANDRLSLQ